MISFGNNIAKRRDTTLKVMFVTTKMVMGGEEKLLVDLIRGLDRERFEPELCCLKSLETLGEQLADEIPVATGLISNKWDIRVLGRLTRLLRQRQVDAVVTVGTGGDKMFWGRLAALGAGVPVVISAIHSTGFPKRIEWLNRRLNPITDAFVAVAETHGRYLSEHEGCGRHQVRVIPNGVDVARFRPMTASARLQAELNLPPGVPVAGVVAMMRHEKNLALWLAAAAQVARQVPTAHFLLIGDGPQRPQLEQRAASLGIADVVRFCGQRQDVPHLLSLVDVFVLSSHMEASPVSILEAMACGKPVVSTAVGSIPEAVDERHSGYLVPAGDAVALADRTSRLLSDSKLARQMGERGRQRVVQEFAVEQMVSGYEQLIQQIYHSKRGQKVAA